MICASCGATNPDSADWCLQCFTDLAGRDREPAGDRFRESGDGQVDWRCAGCGRWNPVGTATCPACGSALTDLFGDREPAATAATGTTVAMVATAVLPGVGHLLCSRTGAGVARAGVYVIWLLGGWLLIAEARDAGQSALPAVPLLLGALLVWAASLVDTYSLVERGTADVELLTPRVFLWLVVAVIGLLITAFVGATMTLAGGG